MLPHTLKSDIYSEFCTLRLPLDRDAFAAVVQEWPEVLAAELRHVIHARFGDDHYSSASVAHAASNLRVWPLDSLTQGALISLGECPLDAANAINQCLANLRRYYWYLMSSTPDTSFSCLSTLPETAGAALVRGLAMAEEFGYSRYCGSVSLVCHAFRVFQSKELSSWTALADWLVTHSTNPWVPFNFRKTRDQWEACKAPGQTPVEIWKAVCDYDVLMTREKHHRAERHQIRTVMTKFRAGQNFDVIASPELRERIIEEMERDILDE